MDRVTAIDGSWVEFGYCEWAAAGTRWRGRWFVPQWAGSGLGVGGQVRLDTQPTAFAEIIRQMARAKHAFAQDLFDQGVAA